MALGEEESARKKLEKLPTPPLDEVDTKADVVDVNGADDDDDVDMQDAGTEEETAAAARAAAEKREERLQSQNLASQGGPADEADGIETAQINGHAADAERGGQLNGSAAPEQQKAEEEEEEEVDALDAFMSGLSEPTGVGKGSSTKSGFGPKGKQAQAQPEALFGDDDVDLNAMDANPGDILAMASKVRKKKDLPAVNHGKMNYEPFRKKFYTEPAELAALTEEEVTELRLELDGIKIRVSSTALII